jgi:RNA polymerase sigma-70 factor, ECF subfamily
MSKAENLRDIIKRCRSGSNEAYAELVDLYSESIYGYFYRMTGNAEISNDLLSDFFLRLVQNIDSFKGGSFKSWIFRIASNLFYDHLRFQQRQKKLIEGKTERFEMPENKVGSQLENVDLLQKALSKLDEDTANLLMMRYFSELSFKELSELRSEPIGTTLAKVRRALIKLRDIMGVDS